MNGDIYPWTLAGGVLALPIALALIANGLVGGGILLSLLGLGFVIGSLVARGSQVREQRHEELLEAVRSQRAD